MESSLTLPKPWKSGKGEPEANRARPSVWVYAWGRDWIIFDFIILSISKISFFHINRSVTSSAVHSAMLVGLDRAKMIGTSLKLQKELCNFDVHSRWHNSNLHNIDEFNT